MIQHLCSNCGSSFTRYNSLQKLCGKCSFNKYSKPGKRIKRVGPVTKKWIETRHEYIKANPPTHNGKWACALGISPQCLKYMDIEQLTIDHIQSRSRRPDLRFEHDNLQPACNFCNSLKGST